MSENDTGTGIRKIVKREPWWNLPPARGEDELSARWGYLVWYDDGSHDFDADTRPSDDEIINRKSCRLPDSCLRTTHENDSE